MMKRKLIAKPSRRDLAIGMFTNSIILLRRISYYSSLPEDDHWCAGPEHRDHPYLVRSKTRGNIASYTTIVTREVGILFGKESEEYRRSSDLLEAIKAPLQDCNEWIAEIGRERDKFRAERGSAGEAEPSDDVFVRDPRYTSRRAELEKRLDAVRDVLQPFVQFHDLLLARLPTV